MSAQVSQERSRSARALQRSLDDLSGVAAVLSAGVRARAVSDACEAGGLAAVLLDASGRVLHVGSRAAVLMGEELRVEADHVLGRDGFANAAVEEVLNPILGQGERGRGRNTLVVVPVSAGESLFIGALAYDDGLPGQLLSAILLIGRNARDLRARAASLSFR